MKIIESGLFHEFEGELTGESVSRTQKLYKDAKGFYAAVDESIDPATVMYEVTTVNADENTEGHLNWAISLLHPVTVCGECCMTRGHFHEDLNCEEYYWCAAGVGLLMLMDEEGNDWCERMSKGTLHHIDGHHAHRLINTGDVDLKVICVWNSNAGHDYARVEKMPFPTRVFKKDGRIVTVRRGEEC